jgi:heptosyltransferase-2
MAKDYPVVLLGAPSERAVSEKVARGIDVINLAGKTDISDAMLLVSNARLVVCNDSMALHMASAFKVPNVAIFCSTSPSFGFGPWQNNAVVLERDELECKPCGAHGWKRCPTGTEACMRELTPQTVVAAAEKLLGIDSGPRDRQVNG